MVRVSVIVPVYNVEKYLPQCLESIRNQSLEEMEILCIDDGSADGSGRILDEFARRDGRFRVIHKKNTGYGSTVNLGLDTARGEYIGIVESDDFIDRGMYGELYRTAHELDLDFIKSGYWEYGGNEKKLANGFSRCECGTVFSRYENMNKVFSAKSVWAGIYKRDFLRRSGIRFLETPGAAYQDVSFWFKVCISADRGYFTEKAYVNYRTDNEGSSVNSREKVYCVCDEMEECRRYLLESGLDLEKIYPYYVLNKKDGYMWNAERIAPEFRKDFIRKAGMELRRDTASPYMDCGGDIGWRLDGLSFFVDYPEGYARYLDREFVPVTLQNMEETIKKEKEIYIYGAGKVGACLGEFLARRKADCEARFVVTEKKGGEQDGTEEIGSGFLDRNTVIVVSVAGWDARKNMAVRALHEGFMKVFVLETDMVQFLLESYVSV